MFRAGYVYRFIVTFRGLRQEVTVELHCVVVVHHRRTVSTVIVRGSPLDPGAYRESRRRHVEAIFSCQLFADGSHFVGIITAKGAVGSHFVGIIPAKGARLGATSSRGSRRPSSQVAASLLLLLAALSLAGCRVGVCCVYARPEAQTASPPSSAFFLLPLSLT